MRLANSSEPRNTTRTVAGGAPIALIGVPAVWILWGYDIIDTPAWQAIAASAVLLVLTTTRVGVDMVGRATANNHHREDDPRGDRGQLVTDA